MITDVPGVLVGHHTDPNGATGCTVILLPPGSVGGYALLGAAPATRETHVLDPANLVSDVHAFVLCGGSAFGLAAADGVMRFLEERGIGVSFGGAVVPIVVAAALFDLAVGDASARPTAEDGYAAATTAGSRVDEGSVGAGTGATVGKWAGRDGAMKGGVGTASAAVGETGALVGAMVACNAAGDVLDDSGGILAGSMSGARPVWAPDPGGSTVLCAVATNARLDKAGATRVARMAAAGLARAVRPAHTPYDGDVVFCAATGEVEAEPALVGAVGAEVVSAALRSGVRKAKGLAGIPGLAG